MSIVSMSSVAFARRADVDIPNVASANAAPNSLRSIELATAGTPNSQNAVTTALKVIVTYIPTEVLTLYVAVLAAIQLPNRTSYRPLWAAFFCFLAATPVIVWLLYAANVLTAGKGLPLSPRTWPLWEMSAATIAYTAWAFALPESPFKYEFSDWYTPALAGVIVLITSTVLGLVAPLFQRPIPS